MTLTRPLNKQMTDAKTGLLSLEWDTFFNAVQKALNELQTSASFTLAAAATKVVNDTRVTANSYIGLLPTNAAAATLQGGLGALYVLTRTPGVSFTVKTGNASSAAGTETFAYSIIG